MRSALKADFDLFFMMLVYAKQEEMFITDVVTVKMYSFKKVWVVILRSLQKIFFFYHYNWESKEQLNEIAPDCVLLI